MLARRLEETDRQNVDDTIRVIPDGADPREYSLTVTVKFTGVRPHSEWFVGVGNTF